MQAVNPLADLSANQGFALYNTGQTSGMNSGTTQSSAASFTSSASSPIAGQVGGSANITVAALVGVSLIVLLGFHLLGFRAMFDASVGRK
jgi:hypothetical protein